MRSLSWISPWWTASSTTAHTGKRAVYVWPHNKLIDLTFPQVLDRMVQEFPDQICFRLFRHWIISEPILEFRDDVDTFARALIAMGVKRGDHVAIWATNVPQWYITFWATTKIGAVLVTVNTAYKIHEAEYLLRQSRHPHPGDDRRLQGFRLCGHHQGAVPGACGTRSRQARCTAKRLPFLRNVITVDIRAAGLLSPGRRRWSVREQVPVEEVLPPRAHGIDKHDVCNMQYTSGTTGFPKGVMLTHYNVVNNGKAIGDCMDLSTADRMMIQVPMFHCFGMVLAMTASMTHGATMSPITAFSPRKRRSTASTKSRSRAFHGVPTMFIAMLEHPDFAKTDFSHMRTGIMAGSPCPIKVMQDVVDQDAHERNLHHLRPDRGVPGYHDVQDHRPAGGARQHRGRRDLRRGMQDRRPGDRTRNCPTTRTASSCARGYNIMKGYYKMPERHRRRHRRGGLAAHRRSGPPRRERQLQDHRPHQGHDHPRRREHLSQGD